MKRENTLFRMRKGIAKVALTALVMQLFLPFNVSVNIGENGLPELALNTLTTSAAGPGGAGTGSLNLWLKADLGAANTGDATAVTAWTDQSSAGNDAISTSEDAQFQLDTSDPDKHFNFNPVVDFDETGTPDNYGIGASNGLGSSLIGYEGLAASAFMVYRGSNGWDAFIGGNNAPDKNIMGVNSVVPFVAYHKSNTGNVGTNTNYDPTETTIVGFVNDTTTMDIYSNGTVSSAAMLTITPHTELFLSHPSYPLDGDLAEIISYSGAITGPEVQQIQSYLALKYGITLDQTSATDYVSSAGTGGLMWDSSVSSTYNKDIAGIGQDSGSELDQKISKSVNNDALVTIASTNDFTSANNDGGRTSVSDMSFLSWANDDGGINFTAVGAPTGRKILNRKWQAQETGTVGSVFISVPDDSSSETTKLRLEETNVYLLVDSDDNFTASGATVREITLSYNATNNAWEGTVDFADEEYFTFATESNNFPGGVSANVQLWLDASDLDGDGVEEGFGESGLNMISATEYRVDTWVDKADINDPGHDVTQSNANARPQLILDEYGDGVHTLDFLQTSTADYLDTTAPNWTNNFTTFIVFQATNVGSLGNNAAFFASQVGGSHSATNQIDYDGSSSFRIKHGTASESTNFAVASSALNLYTSTTELVGGDTQVVTYSDGEQVDTNTWTGDRGRSFEAYSINNNRGGGNNTDSRISEVIIYDRILGACEIEQINNYLGDKYGRDFSGFTTTYSGVAPYDNDVNAIGIAPSDCGGDNQIDSMSSAEVLVDNPSSNDTLNEFMIFAHDGNAIGTPNTVDVPGSVTARQGRAWRVEEETSLGGAADLGTVDVEFDLSALGLTDTGIEDYILLIDDDGTFSNASTGSTSYSYSGNNKVKFSGIDFDTGDFFAIGVLDSSQPTVTVEQAGGQTDPETGTGTISFTATFSEPIANGSFSCGDVSISGTASGSCASVTEVSGQDLYTIEVDHSTNGTIIASLSGAVVTDVIGNDNLASTSSDNSVTVNSHTFDMSYTVYDNGKRRFGNNGANAGVATYTVTEDSIDETNGNLRQPFYYDATASLWYKLTYSTYQLDNTIAVGGDGANLWNINGTVQENTVYNPTIDESGFTYTDDNIGYGDIVTTGTINIAGQTIEVENTITLAETAAYTRIITKVTNTGTGNVTNLRHWIGTRDDWVGITDRPDKTKGNIVDGAFTGITVASEPSSALKIESAGTAVLFLTTYDATKTNSIIRPYTGSYNTVYNNDPTSSAISVTNQDSAYGLFVRLKDLAPNESDEFPWYYAAGPSADINAIISEVVAAADADSATPTVTDPTDGSYINTNPPTVTGTGEIGDVISIYNGSGALLATGAVDGSGDYSIVLPTLSEGQNDIEVTATASGATESNPTEITFTIDTMDPAVPTAVTPTNFDPITGTGEPGSTVTIYSSTGAVVGTGTVSGSGTFSITPSPIPSVGPVTFTTTDLAGNTSTGTTIATGNIDVVDPVAPTVDTPTNFSPLTGTGEIGSTVTIYSSTGAVIGTGVVDGSGNFSVTPSPIPSTGPVNVTSTDDAGNESAQTIISTGDIDVVDPVAPTVDTPTNFSPLTGTGEIGSTVTIYSSTGAVIGTGLVDGSGNFSVTPSPIPSVGPVNVTLTDAVGNEGSATAIATGDIDLVDPVAPTVDTPTNFSPLTGTGEIGSTVTIYSSTGAVIGTGVVDGSGNFSITPSLIPSTGPVNVTSTDDAGNESTQTTISTGDIDVVDPLAPTVDTPTNFAALTGTGEIGTTITIYSSTGAVIGTGVVDGSGNFSITPSPIPSTGPVNVTLTDAVGNEGPATAIATGDIDVVDPTDPILSLPTNFNPISGTGEIGTDVTIYSSTGAVIGTGVVDGSGNFSISPSPIPSVGPVVVELTDNVGNTGSTSIPTGSIDLVAPATPSCVSVPSPAADGQSVTTTCSSVETGGVITIPNMICGAESGGSVTCTGTAGTGTGEISTPDDLVTLSDAAGNTNTSETTNLSLDDTPPAEAILNLPTNFSPLTGNGEAGSTVSVYSSTGALVATGTVNGSGSFSITPSPIPTVGPVNVTLTDLSNNTNTGSMISTGNIDLVDPIVPTIDTPTNFDPVTGTGEPGAIVNIYSNTGALIGTGIVNGSGNFSVTPSPIPSTGPVTITTTDDADNTSTGAAINTGDIDLVDPIVPTIDTPTNFDPVTGTGEPGAIVNIYSNTGALIGTGTVNGSGSFSVTPSPIPSTGPVTITTTDNADNTSTGAAINTGDIDLIVPSVGSGTLTGTTTDTTATIGWETSEPTSSEIVYGLTTSIDSTTGEQDISPRVTSHSLTLTGLNACTTYYYQTISRDDAGNEIVDGIHSLTTDGCTGGADIIEESSTNIIPTASGATGTGGTSTLELGSGTEKLEVAVPAGYFDTGTGTCAGSGVYFQLKQLEKAPITASLGTPPALSSATTIRTYDLSAYCGVNEQVEEFDEELSVTINYSNSDVSGLEENTLKIYRYDTATSAWVELNSCSIDLVANTVTCTTDHFSTFGIFGTTSSSSRGGGGGGGGGNSGGSSSSSSSLVASSSETEDSETEESESSNEEESEAETDTSLETTESAPETNGSTDKGDYTIDDQACLSTDKLLSDTYMPEYETTFGDIDTAVYKEAIIQLEKVGIVKGKEAGVFDPESEITRAEFLAIVLQAHCYDISKKPETLPFYDVDLENWQSNVIQTGLENNIIAGDLDEEGNRVFRANDSISKIEALAIIMNLRSVSLKDPSTMPAHTYTDVAADWQDAYLTTGVNLGILSESETNNIFDPNVKLSRDALVGMMFDIMKLY